jgi:predicted alpha/beta-hydrolase family hydrolase
MAKRKPKVGGLLLAPGAGADRNSPTLVALDDGLDLPVARMDFPYRKEGRKAPDRAPKLLASVVEEAEAFVAAEGIAPGSLVLGGRSMGGRMCSMAVAEGLPAAGLVLLSYPLHPPGKPEKLRIEHLPALDLPVLFVAGTKDPFGSPAEVEAHAAAIPGPVTFHWLEPPNAGHSPKGKDDEIVQVTKDWLATL